MKRLALSLMLVVLVAIAGLGWSISELASVYSQEASQPNAATQLAAVQRLGESLARTLDEEQESASLIRSWNRHNPEQLALSDLRAFVLPPSLRPGFLAGEPLVLESEEGISLHYHLPLTQRVLSISTGLQFPEQQSGINQIFTVMFYAGVVLILLVWVSPLIRSLINLSRVAQAFGMGQLEQRVSSGRVSYIRPIENEFNHMAERIQQLLEDNKLLSRAVSHDLKTPIARLRFGIEALEEVHSEDQRQRYLQRLCRDLDAMEELVAILLQYARLDEANITPNWQSLDLTELVGRALENQQGDDKILILHAPDGLPRVMADPQYLGMQVNNLVSNALRFGQSRVELSLRQEGDRVWLHVEDDGEGIDESEAEQVLKPFVRGRQSRGNAGHGMGLAIVARIAQWMDTRLTVGRSKTLGGAKFSLGLKQAT
ncbi:ATP-binding protein [Ferrimonas sp.]|uniref:ATP-binding protein n=1 Tax=Ferrimonas sp. TaxID=2080861 RepID=UPI003A9260FC